MNKQQFLDSLRARLRGLPESEITRYLDYYREMIDDRMDEGMSEEEAVAAVGSLDEIENRVRSEQPVNPGWTAPPPPVSSPNRLEGWQIALIVIGAVFLSPLILAAAATVFGLLTAVVAVIAGFYASLAALFCSGLVRLVCGIAALAAEGVAYGLLSLGIGFFLMGGSVLLFLALNKLSALIFKGLGRMFGGIGNYLNRRRQPA